MSGTAPHQVQVMLTERCNLECVHCAVPEEDSPAARELSGAEWEQVIDDLAMRGVKSLVFSGGEALIRPEAVGLLRRALANGIPQTTLVANMSVFSPRIAAEIAAAQRAFPSFGLQISIDGASASTHDWMRGEGQFARLQKNCETLRELGGAVSGVNSMLHRGNVHELEELALLARALGAANLRLFPIAALGRGVNLQASVLDEQAWRDVFRRLPALQQQTGLDIMCMGPVLGGSPSTDELAPNPNGENPNRLLLGPDGEIFLCPPLRHRRLGLASQTKGPERWAEVFINAEQLVRAHCHRCAYLLLCVGVKAREPTRTAPTQRFSPPDRLVALGKG
jgi:radical SAM protein with 4Fe4S-binding SPASM domain